MDPQEEEVPPLDGIHPAIYKCATHLLVYVLNVKEGEPVSDFLGDRKRVSRTDEAGLFAILEMLDANRNYRNGQKYKKLEDYKGKALFELKKNQVRIGCFWAEGHRDAVLLAFGCIKKGNDWKEGDLKQFRNRYQAYADLAETIKAKKEAEK